MTISVHITDFCENCGKTRNTSLVRVGQWFIWYCFPCQLRRSLRDLFK